jgi:hypothetical protein
MKHMNTKHELITELINRTNGTPYIITETDDGFRLTLNLVDAKYYTLMYKNGLKKTFTIDAKVDEPKRSVTTTDTLYELDWQAGADVNTFTPRIGAKLDVQKGEVFQFEMRKQYGVSEQGKVGKVVDLKYSTVEIKKWLDTQLADMKWKREMGGIAKGALVVAAIAGVGAVAAVVLALVK